MAKEITVTLTEEQINAMRLIYNYAISVQKREKFLYRDFINGKRAVFRMLKAQDITPILRGGRIAVE